MLRLSGSKQASRCEKKAEPAKMEALEERRLLAAGLPQPDHVVVVMEENHSFSQIMKSPPPYIKSLADQGAVFTDSRALTHPSQPNYLDLFSGSDQGVKSDATPKRVFATPNLGGELLANGLSFAGYSEDLPAAGFRGSKAKNYRRKHNPWVDFADVPDSSNLPFSSFPTDFTQLPTVSFVVPNEKNDMHSGSVGKGDKWLMKHLDAYAQWAQSNNSLLIVTFDEGSRGSNQIPTIFDGRMVMAGRYPEPINHFNVLRTIEDMFDLPAAGASATATPIADVWTPQSVLS